MRDRVANLQKIKGRRWANVQILWMLLWTILDWKDARIGQVIKNLELDSYYEEPVDALKRLQDIKKSPIDKRT